MSIKNSKGVSNSEAVNYILGGNDISGGNYIMGGNDIFGGNDICGGNNIMGGNDIWGGNDIRGGNCIRGAFNCRGIDRCIFCADLRGATLRLFNKEITEERFNEVTSKLYSFYWYPKFNNALELKEKAGSWEKVNASEIKSIEPYEAWKNMPKEMLDYIKGLEEFDTEIFKKITGIKDEEMINIDGKEVSKSTVKEALKQFIGNL